ncbi:MAG: hypothetical protein IJH92_05335, partial [Mogibacterium sp.]|nr:hypothetical protein [Mogibacterium sp.]
MTALENIRRTIDRLYHAKLWDAFGALTVMYAIKILLATSGLTSGTCWACGAAVGLAFYAVPAFSVILAAIAAFMAISHISGLMAAVIVLLMVLLYSSSHPTAWATIMMPLAFIPGSPLQPVGFAILFFGLCMYSKYEYSYKPAFFSTLWGAWSLFFCASGLPNFLYAEGFNFVPYQGKLDDIFNSFDLMRDYQILQTAGIQNFLIILGAFLVLGVIAHWLFVKARLIRTLNQDVIDAVSFLILTVLTIVVYVVIRVVCKADVQLPIGGAV